MLLKCRHYTPEPRLHTNKEKHGHGEFVTPITAY